MSVGFYKGVRLVDTGKVTDITELLEKDIKSYWFTAHIFKGKTLDGEKEDSMVILKDGESVITLQECDLERILEYCRNDEYGDLKENIKRYEASWEEESKGEE